MGVNPNEEAEMTEHYAHMSGRRLTKVIDGLLEFISAYAVHADSCKFVLGGEPSDCDCGYRADLVRAKEGES